MSAGDLVFLALQRAEVRYLMVGGVAVVLHGHPRFTADLDLVVDLGAVRVPVAGLEDLVAMKRAAGRPKDLEDVRQLEAIAAEQRRG